MSQKEMSPHGIVVLTALLLAGIAKLAYPQSTLRIVATVVVGILLAIMAVLGEPPSLLGLMIVAPLAVVGAVLGVAAGRAANRLWRGRRGPR